MKSSNMTNPVHAVDAAACHELNGKLCPGVQRRQLTRREFDLLRQHGRASRGRNKN
jgi:hypothetical protein